MIEKLLDTVKKRVDSAEVFSVESSTMEISFEAGKLKSTEHKLITGIGLRVIKDGRMGFSSSTDLQRLDKIVDYACAASEFGKEVAFDFPSHANSTDVTVYDPAVESYTPEEAVKEGRYAIEQLRETVPQGLTELNISASTDSVRIINTAGLDVSYRSTDFSHSITSIIVDGDSILWISDGGHYGDLTLKSDDYVNKIGDLAQKAEKKAPGVSGTLPVIFIADEMGELLDAIEIGVDGKRMLKGDSPLIGREGEQLLGSVTLIDNPFIANAPGSRPFDDEGVPSQRTDLFKNGTFQSFLFDLDTAAKTGNVSTASAERGGLSTLSIGTSNLVMSGGTSNLNDMVSELQEGIIIHGGLGGGQSNLLAGDFALNIMLGFLVRGGEIAGRLVDTMVSGNVYSAFGAIGQMSEEVRQVGSLFVPDVLFSELSVSSR
ncbi:TldD/PmbA family protein [Candidatus Omnitrophota bacterium]